MDTHLQLLNSEHGNQILYRANHERAVAYLDVRDIQTQSAVSRLHTHLSLQRYYYLIAFNAYLSEADTMTMGFDAWMNERKELRSLLKEISLD